ncbi:MAG: DUF1559 domain-containing protein [Gemmataceae bacterium]|nr:DUF1559 domain-containing protein [Gemmataceae bacterium]
MTRRADVTHGLSNTWGVFQDVGRPDLYQGGKKLGTGSSNESWADPENAIAVQAWCGSAINCHNNNERYSFHTGGMNTLIGDGSVRFTSASISAQSFIAMHTRGNSDSPAPITDPEATMTLRATLAAAVLCLALGCGGKTHAGGIALDGTFSIENLPPGEYRIAVGGPDPAKAAGKKKPLPPPGAWFPLPHTAGDPETSGLTGKVESGKPLDLVVP